MRKRAAHSDLWMTARLAGVACAAAFSGLACEAQPKLADRGGDTSGLPSPEPTAIPIAPQINLYGEDDWSAMASLPADPIPMIGTPDSVDVSRVTFAAEGADFDPAVASSGGFMVFASTQHHHNPDIYLKAIDSTILTQLTNDPARDVMPSISPDGEWIAFASDRTLDWNIYVMPRSGGRPVQVTWERSAELHPSWSPDGSKLAYSKLGQASGRWEIWIAEVANSATPHFVGYGLFPEWCPKAGSGANGGDVLIYQRSADRGDRAFGIWSIELKDGKTSSPSQLIGNPTTAYINPSWSPDGQYIVFASVADPHSVRSATGGVGHDSDLWMMSADGSTIVSLTNGSSSDLMPAWGSDGRIYFVSTRTGRDNVWSMNAGQAMLAAGLNPPQPLANAPSEE